MKISVIAIQVLEEEWNNKKCLPKKEKEEKVSMIKTYCAVECEMLCVIQEQRVKV